MPFIGRGGSSPPSDTPHGEASPALRDAAHANAAALTISSGTCLEAPTPTGLIRAKQTERLVAALIPPTTAPTVAVPDAAATVLPLPALAPVQPARFVHRTALLDDHGRVREATLFALLGWKPQQTVELVEHGAGLLVRATPDGPVVLDPKGRVRIPDALRKFRGWAAG